MAEWIDSAIESDLDEPGAIEQRSIQRWFPLVRAEGGTYLRLP